MEMRRTGENRGEAELALAVGVSLEVDAAEGEDAVSATDGAAGVVEHEAGEGGGCVRVARDAVRDEGCGAAGIAGEVGFDEVVAGVGAELERDAGVAGAGGRDGEFVGAG